ncbi:hypothetical protein IDJ77_04185 [Mucilaginibacter sp. ZT4R22]|uniref:Uncharacterized protein n=1 Tax=Mucilaginibacter pankratovii TaxID=2772110 RepID=A0ABR7WL08_9SPHI|nr:hypothetical protein [Mucilaginibacter pankratovii]MBD1363001.1 hypothetical protein [Mucilaginibacter pankratovii]
MTTNFTFRDFLVYLMTGLLLLITLGIIFFQIVVNQISCISVQYTFVKDYAVILVIFLIPFIYIVGHIVNTIDFIMMKYYVWLHPLLKTSKWWRWFLKINEFLFYRHRIVFQVVTYWKGNTTPKAFSTTEEFWILCAKLQKDKNYDNAGYWYILNDLFKAVYVIFFAGCLISAIEHKWYELLLFFVLLIFAKIRAHQFACFFVDTVARLSKST